MTSFFYDVMDMGVEYFVNKLTEYSGEGLTKVYCCEKCFKSRLCRINTLENCLRHVYEKSVSRLIESETVLSGGERDVWYYVM